MLMSHRSSVARVNEQQVSKVVGICGICPGGCGVEIELVDGRIERLRPLKGHPAGIVCPRGVKAKEIVYSPDRLMHPLARVGAKGEGRFERVEDATGQVLGLVGAVDPRRQDGELVAANTGQGVFSPDQAGQARSHCRERFIAPGVPETIVDGLEAVEVEKQERNRLAATPGAFQGVLQPVSEEQPVGKPGQGVIERLPLKLLFEKLAHGDIDEVAHDCALAPELDGGDAAKDPAALAEAGDEPVFVRLLALAPQHLERRDSDRLPLLGRHEPQGFLSKEFLLGVSGPRLQLLVDELLPAVLDD